MTTKTRNKVIVVQGSAAASLRVNEASGIAGLYYGETEVFRFSATQIIPQVEILNQGGGDVSTNTAYGDDALAANTTGADNSAFGQNALEANTVGSRNVAVGNGAILIATAGNDNIAIGVDALNANTTGSENVAIGTDALGANTIGTFNVAIGDDALLANTTGVSNVGVGRDALVANTVGANNVALGDQAGNTVVSGTGNICIGQDAQTGSTTGVDRIVIGRGVDGIANAAITLGNANRAITCNYDADQTWDAPSDLRMKNVIGASSLGLDFIKALRPIEYTFKPVEEWPEEWGADPSNSVNTTKTILGLGAQDVKQALDMVGRGAAFHGWDVSPNGQQLVGEAAFVYPLINAVRELAAEVAELRTLVQA